MKGLFYNTQLPPLVINEYGRILQNFVNHILTIPDKEKRTEQTKALVQSAISLNPQLKELEDCEHIVWDYLHIMADYKLDVDSPYPIPNPETKLSKPLKVDYTSSNIKFRYYGANLQNLIDNVENVTDNEHKQEYLDMIGSFMKNSGKNWNDDNITTKQILLHIKTLSKGKIDLKEDEINTDLELLQRTSINSNPKRKNFKKTNNFRSGAPKNNNNSNKYNKNRR